MKKTPIIGTLFASLIASLCCLGPAILAALGLGSAGAAAWLAKSHRFFYLLGLAVLGSAIFFRRKQESCCPSKPASARTVLKTLTLIFSVGVLFFALQYGLTHQTASWLYKQAAPPAPAASLAESRTVLVSISGMTCISCAKGIEAYLRQAPGIYAAQVSFEKKKAMVCYNPRRLSKNDIEKRIEETGYSGKTISETDCRKPVLPENGLSSR